MRPAVILALLFVLFTLAFFTLPSHAAETPGNPTGIPLMPGVWNARPR